MKYKTIFFVTTLMLNLSCVQNSETKKNDIQQDLSSRRERYFKKVHFKNTFEKDSTLEKKIAFDFIKISNNEKTDSIISICNCDKNIKDNSIKIQIETGIPTQKELDTMSDSSNKRWNTILQTRFGPVNEFSGQFKFLNIELKDSLVKSINIYSKSTENEYNGADFDSLTIDRFKIKISKFDYSIASNVYGEFELRLDKSFGLFENDTILKGRFLCNNWIIRDKEKIKNWEIN
ncbi:hypothetical protein [uncultured Mesonia sp.]|uniref:hypothetical protein n=1 Tax=uncultured Mesonia sp. TaxID=399731 RepID=UPI00374E7E88